MKFHYAVVNGQEDDALQRVIDQHKSAIQEQGGEVHLSKGFSTTPAVIVLSLPDGVEPAAVFPGYSFEEVTVASSV